MGAYYMGTYIGDTYKGHMLGSFIEGLYKGVYIGARLILNMFK